MLLTSTPDQIIQSEAAATMLGAQDDHGWHQAPVPGHLTLPYPTTNPPCPTSTHFPRMLQPHHLVTMPHYHPPTHYALHPFQHVHHTLTLLTYPTCPMPTSTMHQTPPTCPPCLNPTHSPTIPPTPAYPTYPTHPLTNHVHPHLPTMPAPHAHPTNLLCPALHHIYALTHHVPNSILLPTMLPLHPPTHMLPQAYKPCPI